MRHFPSPLSRQHGLATLAVSLIMLFLMSLLIFNTSSGMLLELKTGNNQYFQAKALEAARGGADYTVSWLDVSGNYSGLTWSSDATGPSGNNQQAALPSSVASQTIGGYSVAVTLWRNSANTSILEVRAVASGDAIATVRQKIHAKTISFNTTSVPPLVVNGCLPSGVASNKITGNPAIYPDHAGDTVITTSGSASSSCMNTGNLDLNNGVIQGNAFSGNAWDYVFATSKADMKELAAQSSSDFIYYYDTSNPAPNNWHDSIGTTSNPAILIFDTGSGCPKINGNVTIYGVVYYAGECSSNQGWGNAEIHGSVVVDGSIDKLSANTEFYPWSGSTAPSYTIAMDFAKLPASWRDF